MIQLKADCLIFQTANGEQIPCSAELVTIELIGEAAKSLDPDIVRNASAAVLHYFKNELGRNFVSVGEFSQALEQVLRGFGLTVTSEEKKSPVRVAESDLRELACASGKGFELFFFFHLREEIRGRLDQSPQLIRFRGLRGCVKQLVGARRWSRRCQSLNDQIVDYLRACLTAEPRKEDCALLVC